jgi:hypothetical protein
MEKYFLPPMASQNRKNVWQRQFCAALRPVS